MSKRIFSISFIVFVLSFSALSKTVDILVGIKKGWISVEVKGKGGYSEKSIILSVKNLRKRKIEIFVPAGLVFTSVDSTEQDLVVVQERLLAMGKQQRRKFSLRAMCTQAAHISPDVGSLFRIKGVADAHLKTLADYINQKRSFDDAAQYAIWAVTDDKRVENIGDSDLAVFTAQLLGKEIPRYHIVHDQRGRIGRSAFVYNPSVIKGVFKYKIKKEETVSFGLYDESGLLLEGVFADKIQKKGGYKFRFRFEVSNIDPGKYYAKLIGVNGLIDELEVVF